MEQEKGPITSPVFSSNHLCGRQKLRHFSRGSLHFFLSSFFPLNLSADRFLTTDGQRLRSLRFKVVRLSPSMEESPVPLVSALKPSVCRTVGLILRFNVNGFHTIFSRIFILLFNFRLQSSQRKFQA